MKLPNREQVVIDDRKMIDYILNPDHARGKHKAKVFLVTLGISTANAVILIDALKDVAQESEAFEFTSSDQYGQRFQLDFELKTLLGTAIIRSGWIIRHDEQFPRFASCYVLRKGKQAP